MDNVTHSLAGLLLVESAVQLRRRVRGEQPSPRFRTVAAVTSVVAANLPDADLVYTGIGGNRLRYMLHHRGYTHTIVMAIVGALLIWGVALIVWRWRARDAPAREDAGWLFGLLLVSTLSHLLLDWTNSYGVHPYWPLDDRWRYGDAVFIIEPWLWVVSVPVLVAASARRGVRVVLVLVLAGGLMLAWGSDLVSTYAAACLTIGALASAGLAFALRSGIRATAAVVAWVAVTMVMAAGAAAARGDTLRAIHDADPRTQVLDVVVSPLPANAVCMSVISVELSGARYRVATARASGAPSITPASSCGSRSGGGMLLGAPTRTSTAAVHWDGEWTAPSAEIRTLVHESCPALAALRFIRVPIWKAVNDSIDVIGDVRYGGVSESGFTSVRVPRRSATCPARVPPWVPPRADLLGSSAG